MVDYKSLFAKLERTLGQIERADEGIATPSAIVERLVVELGSELGIDGGRLYDRDGDDFVLRFEFPPAPERLGYRIPVDYPPVRELLESGFVLRDPGDPGVDREIEGDLGVRAFAAIRVGGDDPWLIAFSLRDRSDRDHVLYTLNTIRHAVNLRLRSQRLEDRVAAVREIQASLLPATPPRFHDFDLWAATRTAEEVGGDLFDFIPVSDRSLGIAIADSAGHGLPAALQGRDAIIGLRMGVEERLRITAAIEKLNRVVSRSALSTRFISLFYAEAEPNGNLVYCNAGHNPALLLRDGQIERLTEGGLILGPNPEAQYQRGYTRMTPGAVLLLYTDGIVEAPGRRDEMFGLERLEQLLRSRPWRSARALVDEVFSEVRRFSPLDPPVDDQTVVAVVRRAPAPATERPRSPGTRG